MRRSSASRGHHEEPDALSRSSRSQIAIRSAPVFLSTVERRGMLARMRRRASGGESTWALGASVERSDISVVTAFDVDGTLEYATSHDARPSPPSSLSLPQPTSSTSSIDRSMPSTADSPAMDPDGHMGERRYKLSWHEGSLKCIRHS